MYSEGFLQPLLGGAYSINDRFSVGRHRGYYYCAGFTLPCLRDAELWRGAVSFARDGIKFYSLPHLKCYLKEKKQGKIMKNIQDPFSVDDFSLHA